MNRDEITAKFSTAKDLVSGILDPSDRRLALEVVFRKLLEEGLTAREATTPLPGLARVPAQVSEFLAALNARSHSDRVVGIAYHSLRTERGPVTSADLGEAYARARTTRPKNMSDVIAQCVKRGYVVEAFERKEGQKAWEITPTGEAYIEEKLTEAARR